MSTAKHLVLGAAVGAVAAAAPDVVLATYGWRRTWLGPHHPLVRAHHVLHDPRYLVPVAAAVGWASHVIADRYSTHREGPR